MELSARYDDALVYAAAAHRGQVRKGTTIPYISHPLAVSALVLENGGTEDQAIAALLHDVIEDCGRHHEAVIREQFGDAVADMVLACSDATPAEGEAKPPWRERKERYLDHLRDLSADNPVLLVTTCDKLHNIRAIEADLADIGERLWERFNATAEDERWYYTEVARILATSGGRAATELVAIMERVFGSME